MSTDTLKQFYLELSNADINNDVLFTHLLNKGLELFQLTDKEVAIHFGMSLISVRRWKAGKNIPFPSIRPALYEFFMTKVKKYL